MERSDHDNDRYSEITDTSPSKSDIPSDEIYFRKPKSTDYYCVCLVDMVGSTQITAQINDSDKIAKYYSIFLNAMAAIAKNFGSKVIKNVGDGLIFYFPDTSDSNNKSAFKEAFECFNAIIVARDLINERIAGEHLPEVSYRLSADYGRVQVGTAVTSGAEDFFGPTINMCVKINHKAERNGIVIGADLYQVIRQFPFEVEYDFKEIQGYSFGLKQSYPLYSLRRKERDLPFRDNLISAIFRRPEGVPKSTSEPSPRSVDMIQTESRHKCTVMLVDDEPDLLSTFKSFLLTDTYAVEAFTDPYKALQTFARSQPRHFDLIILDIRMPSMNGIQLYQRLKAIDPHIKVIFLTALDAAEELVSVLEGLSSVDVMKKPIGKKHFLQRVEDSMRDLSSSFPGDAQAG
jgi:two-component system, OmpR family, response regulator ChvI